LKESKVFSVSNCSFCCQTR